MKRRAAGTGFDIHLLYNTLRLCRRNALVHCIAEQPGAGCVPPQRQKRMTCGISIGGTSGTPSLYLKDAVRRWSPIRLPKWTNDFVNLVLMFYDSVKMGGDDENPTYIFTEPRVGYRMAGERAGRVKA